MLWLISGTTSGEKAARMVSDKMRDAGFVVSSVVRNEKNSHVKIGPFFK